MASRYESIHHPGERPWAAVYGRALVRPLAGCMLPVMLFTLVAVLEGLRVVPHAYWGAAAAVVVASAWTSYHLRGLIAEIRVDGPWAHVLSVWDVARGGDGTSTRVLDVRDYGSWSDLTLGWSSYELDRSHWPDYAELVAALQQARQFWYSRQE